MTTYGAYDAGLPCKNPSCKSHGKPHPNCRCYGDMAEGGEVAHFCSKDQPHEVGCEYFADGGTVESPLHIDPANSVVSFLINGGLHGLIKMGADVSDESLDKYNVGIKRGQKDLEKKIDHLFAGKKFDDEDHSKSRKSIHDWISKGGITSDIQEELHSEPQMFAKGGEVKKDAPILHDHPVAHAYPEQNLLLQMAKGRMSNYLSGLKPQENVAKLTYDSKPDDRHQKKSYQKALHIAAHPLSVLEEVQRGTITPEHIGHFKSLHPEVDEAMQKKITERIIKDQLSGGKPSYKVRQGLSMMLGTPLGSEMTQPNMQAVQMTFQSKKQQEAEQAPVKNRRGTSTLTKANQPYLTRNEALTARQQKT